MKDLGTLDDAGLNKRFEFKGEGGEYFGILIVNALLTAITFGIYYPWAKTKERHFLHSNTYLANSPFAYHGTAKEILIGFLKAIAIFVIPYFIVFGISFTNNEILIIISILLFFVYILTIIPFAIHGSLRYQTSRTSWRGIYFAYTGDRNAFAKLFFKNIFLSIITIGFYSSWASVNIRKYITDNLNFGNVTSTFKGKGVDLFVISLVGMLLTMLTLGIYSFWYIKNVFNFYVTNTELQQDGRIISLNSTVSAGGIFGITVVNILLIIFTLGLATPWVVIRTIRFYMDNVTLDNNFRPDEIVQGVIDATANATGDDVLDILIN